MEKGGEADAFFLVLFNQFLFSSIRMDICYLLSASHVTFFFFSKLLRFVCKIFQYIVSFMESWREFFYDRIEQDRSKFHLEKG